MIIMIMNNTNHSNSSISHNSSISINVQELAAEGRRRVPELHEVAPAGGLCRRRVYTIACVIYCIIV